MLNIKTHVLLGLCRHVEEPSSGCLGFEGRLCFVARVMVEVGSISLLVGLRAVLLFLSAFAAMHSTSVGDERRVEVHLSNVLYIGQPLILLE